MKTTRKLLGTALAFAFAAILAGCGDDSSTSGGNGGNGGNAADNVKKQQALEQAAEMQAAIAQAIATGDYSALDQYGIDEDCAQDSVCLKGKIAEGLDAVGIPGLSGACMLDADCFQAWSDSVAASVDWAFSGNKDYDNGCSYVGAGMVCQEILWNSSDTAAARRGAQECAALQSGYAAQYGEISVGPCSKKKNKCTISSHKDSRLALFDAEYGTSDVACQDVDDDEGGDDDEYAWGYMEMDGGACYEVHTLASQLGADGGMYQAGQCPSEYSVACVRALDPSGSYVQFKITTSSSYTCAQLMGGE